jgi:hypothetical protein
MKFKKLNEGADMYEYNTSTLLGSKKIRETLTAHEYKSEKSLAMIISHFAFMLSSLANNGRWGEGGRREDLRN